MFLAAGPVCLERPKQRKGGLVNQGSRYIWGRRTTCLRKAKVKEMLEPPGPSRTQLYLPTLGGPKASCPELAAAHLMDPCRVNLTHPAGAALLHICTQPGERVGNAVDAAVPLQMWFSILGKWPFARDTQTSSFWKNVFSHCSEQQRLCCKQQTSIQAGRAGRSAECAWIQCSWDPDTAVCELYQEDTTTELLPNLQRITRLGSPSLVLLGREEERTFGWGSNGIIHNLFLHFLVHIQSLHCFSNLSIHHFQLVYFSFALIPFFLVSTSSVHM